jgi:hypothetical protein
MFLSRQAQSCAKFNKVNPEPGVSRTLGGGILLKSLAPHLWSIGVPECWNVGIKDSKSS